MKTFLTEIKKKSKMHMINEAKTLTTQLDGFDESKLKSMFVRGRAGIRS
jgi:hypothetical protein